MEKKFQKDAKENIYTISDLKYLIQNLLEDLDDPNVIIENIETELNTFREEFIKNISDFDYLQSIMIK